MSDPFVAEIRIVGFNFAPRGWAFCNGQLLPISQNTALFALLGTTYGGDGKSTFALPDLRGAAAMHPGQGQGLSLRNLGQRGGTAAVTLLSSEMPSHTHGLSSSGSVATTSLPSATVALSRSAGGSGYKALSPGPLAPMAGGTLAPAGGSLPHNNMMPYLALNFIIALAGIFPPRP